MATDGRPRARNGKADWRDLFHTGPGTLAGRFMRAFWQPVYRAEDLPRGKAKPIRIMGEDFTLYRGEAGVPHLVAFRCAHRRTQLSIGWVEGDNIRCRYHGWAYGPSGQCVDQPAEPEPFCHKIAIGGYPTEEYLGLVFAYLGDGPAPPLSRYPDFEQPGVLEVSTYVRACNYFNNIENDPVHVPFVHRRPDLDWLPSRDQAPAVSARETDFGILEEVAWPTGKTSRSHKGMPNVSFRLASAYLELQDSAPTDHLSWRVPFDDERHLSFNVDHIRLVGEKARHYLDSREAGLDDPNRTLGISERVLAGTLDLEETHLAPTNLINLEDDVVQAGQGAIPDHENEHLGRSDAGVVLRRRVWERELRALAEGRPLKQWAMPTFPARAATL